MSPVTTILGAPEHELCVIFRKKTDRLDQKTGTTAPPKPRKKRIYTCHTCGRIGHSSTYCHRYPPDPIPSNTQPAQSQSSQPQQTLTNVRISPALPSYTTTTATNTSLNEKTWLYDARERETRIDNSRKEARDLNRFKQRTKQPQKFDKLAPQKDRITSNPALKLQVKTLELTFSGRKLSIKSIRAQLRCALNRHWAPQIKQCVITRIGKSQMDWNLTYTGHDVHLLRSAILLSHNKFPFTIIQCENDWVKKVTKNYTCIRFSLKTSVVDEYEIREHLEIAMGKRWANETKRLHIQVCKRGKSGVTLRRSDHFNKHTGKPGISGEQIQRHWDCRTRTKFPDGFVSRLKWAVRLIRPEKKGGKRRVRASKQRWRACVYFRGKSSLKASKTHIDKVSKIEAESESNENGRYEALMRELDPKDLTHEADQATLDMLEKHAKMAEKERKEDEQKVKDALKGVKKVKHLTLGCWNIRKTGGTRGIEIVKSLRRKNVKVLAVTESGETPDGIKAEFPGYIWWGKADPNPSHSIGFAFRTDMLYNVFRMDHEIEENGNATCNTWIKILVNSKRKEYIYMGNYYVPNDNKTVGNGPKRKSAVGSIRTNIKYIQKRYGKDARIVICGDMNLTIGVTPKDCNQIFGKWNINTPPCLSGKRLRNTIVDCGLICMNGRHKNYKTHQNMPYTREGKVGTKEGVVIQRTAIDYFFTSHLKCFMDIHHDCKDVSDHCLLTLDIYHEYDKTAKHARHENKSPRPKTDELLDTRPGKYDDESIALRAVINENVEDMVRELKLGNLFDKVKEACDDDDASRANEIQITSVQHALFKVRGTKGPGGGKPDKENYATEELHTKIDELMNKHLELVTSKMRGRRNSEAWEEYTRMRDDKNRLEKSLRKKHKKKRARTYKKYKRIGDRKLFDLMDDLNNNDGKTEITALMDENGVVHTSGKEIRSRWYRFGKTMFDPDKSPAEECANLVYNLGFLDREDEDWKPFQRVHETCHRLGNDMSIEEIWDAIDSGKTGKSGGPGDGITVEVYKALRNYIAPILQLIFNTVIRTGKVPESWRNGAICNIHKGNSPMMCGNYRGIMLLNISGKLFNWILAKRITTYCDKERILNDRQDGFMPKRGGTGHSMSVTEIIIDRLNRGKNPYVFYLDLSKAFDCINRKVIYDNLRKAGIPRKLVNLIADMHHKTTACYRTSGGTTKKIRTVRGVPQGDPLSPIIFNLVINPMLDELERHGLCRKLSSGGIKTDGLYMYADDFLCVCDTKKDLQDAINICWKCINYFDLQANVTKSACMRFWSPKTRESVKLEAFNNEIFYWGVKGPALPNVKDYKYLGMKLDWDMNWDKHFKHCIKKYHQAVEKCRTTFKDSEMCISVKIDILKSIVWPSDRHALEMARFDKKLRHLYNANVRQMNAVKLAMKIDKQNHNSLLRLMLNVADMGAIQEAACVGVLKKTWMMDDHHSPRRTICAWDEKTLKDGPCRSILRENWMIHREAIMGNQILDLDEIRDCSTCWGSGWGVEDTCTKCEGSGKLVRRTGKPYDKNALTVKQSKHALKKQILDENIQTHTKKLSHTKTIPDAVRDYRRQNKWHGIDPILPILHTSVTSRWLNACNTERSDKFDICPLCGDNDSSIHAYETCSKLGSYKTSLRRSLNTKLSIWERKQHVEHFIRLLDKRKRMIDRKGKRTTEIVSDSTIFSLRVETRRARELGSFNELRPPTPGDLVRPVREFKDAPGVRTDL